MAPCGVNPRLAAAPLASRRIDAASETVPPSASRRAFQRLDGEHTARRYQRASWALWAVLEVNGGATARGRHGLESGLSDIQRRYQRARVMGSAKIIP